MASAPPRATHSELIAQLAATSAALERERAESERLRGLRDALRDSEERFRLLVAHIADAVFMLDADGRIATWTPAAGRIFGYSESEAVNMRVDELLPRKEQRSQTLAAMLDRARTSGRLEVEGWWPRKQGRVWGHGVTCPILGPHGELKGYAQIVQDRTELRLAEQALAKHAAELTRSNQELEAFASIAAHDLQEPLRKLRMFSDRLQQRFGSSLDADASSLVERMAAAAQRMQLLIDALLAYSRVGRSARPASPIELTTVLAEVLSDLSSAIEATGARIHVGTLPAVVAEPTQMRQVFQNLVSNALKFRHPDRAPNIHIEGAVLEGGEVELRVQDDGIGFEAKYADRIFGLFQRLHGRSQYDGSGMGLSICKRIIERHGGTITADARLGEGATFTIRMPAQQAEPEEAV